MCIPHQSTCGDTRRLIVELQGHGASLKLAISPSSNGGILCLMESRRRIRTRWTIRQILTLKMIAQRKRFQGRLVALLIEGIHDHRSCPVSAAISHATVKLQERGVYFCTFLILESGRARTHTHSTKEAVLTTCEGCSPLVEGTSSACCCKLPWQAGPRFRLAFNSWGQGRGIMGAVHDDHCTPAVPRLQSDILHQRSPFQ